MRRDRSIGEATMLYLAGYIPLSQYLALLPSDRARVRVLAQEVAEMARRDDEAIEEQRRKPKLRIVR